MHKFGRHDDATDASDDAADEQVDSDLIECTIVLFYVIEGEEALHDESSCKSVSSKEETQHQNALNVFLFDA